MAILIVISEQGPQKTYMMTTKLEYNNNTDSNYVVL